MVGRDNISDFTTNLIKDFLCKYTETVAATYLPSEEFREDLNLAGGRLDEQNSRGLTDDIRSGNPLVIGVEDQDRWNRPCASTNSGRRENHDQQKTNEGGRVRA